MRNEIFYRQVIHAIGILLVISIWRTAHASALTDQQKLEQLRPFIGEEAYNYTRSNHLSKLSKCKIYADTQNPDEENTFDPLARFNAWSDVMMHDYSLTTRESNNGIVSYMRNAVTSDANFFQTAFYYYQWLKSQDQIWQANHQQELTASPPSPIIVQADNKDLLTKALTLSGWNHYQAFKIMALYGHDNLVNKLSFTFKPNDCRWVIMDLVKPEQSQLYHNAAIPQVEYNNKVQNDAQAITDSCNASATAMTDLKLKTVLHGLCNDRRSSYQADYYHVITSSFLNCRGEIAWEREGYLPGTIIPFMNFADESTRNSQEYFVRQYKYDRFMEEIERAEFPIRLKAALVNGLDAIIQRQSPFKNLSWRLLMYRQPQDIRHMLKSILNRYEFEINFRVYQHRIGADYARSQCVATNTFGQAGSQLQLIKNRDQTRIEINNSGLPASVKSAEATQR